MRPVALGLLGSRAQVPVQYTCDLAVYEYYILRARRGAVRRWAFVCHGLVDCCGTLHGEGAWTMGNQEPRALHRPHCHPRCTHTGMLGAASLQQHEVVPAAATSPSCIATRPPSSPSPREPACAMETLDPAIAAFDSPNIMKWALGVPLPSLGGASDHPSETSSCRDNPLYLAASLAAEELLNGPQSPLQLPGFQAYDAIVNPLWSPASSRPGSVCGPADAAKPPGVALPPMLSNSTANGAQPQSRLGSVSRRSPLGSTSQVGRRAHATRTPTAHHPSRLFAFPAPHTFHTPIPTIPLRPHHATNYP
jgi:hypothetical protein